MFISHPDPLPASSLYGRPYFFRGSPRGREVSLFLFKNFFDFFFLVPFPKGYIYSKDCIFWSLSLVYPSKQNLNQIWNRMLPHPALSVCNSFPVILPLGRDRSLLCGLSCPGLAPGGSLQVFSGHSWEKGDLIAAPSSQGSVPGCGCLVAFLIPEIWGLHANTNLDLEKKNINKGSIFIIFLPYLFKGGLFADLFNLDYLNPSYFDILCILSTFWMCVLLFMYIFVYLCIFFMFWLVYWSGFQGLKTGGGSSLFLPLLPLDRCI